MSSIRHFFARLARNTSGATAIEYALLAALVGIAIISGATALGSAMNNTFNSDATKVTAAGS